MQRTKKQWYVGWILNSQRCEQWLQQQAQQGWLINAVSMGGFRFHFIASQPQLYTFYLAEQLLLDAEELANLQQQGWSSVFVRMRTMLWMRPGHAQFVTTVDHTLLQKQYARFRRILGISIGLVIIYSLMITRFPWPVSVFVYVYSLWRIAQLVIAMMQVRTKLK